MGVHRNEMEIREVALGLRLTGQRLIERTKRRGENVENAGLQRDGATFQIFGPW